MSLPALAPATAEAGGEILGPLLGPAALLKRALLAPRSLRLAVVLLGPPGAPEALYVGEGESLGFLARLHGGAAPAGSLALAALRARLARPAGVPLLYAEVSRALAWLLPRAGLRTAPWVRQVVELGSHEERRHRRARAATIGRRVRRAGLTWRRTRDDAAVVRFHRELYLPYVRQRFAELAHPRSERALRAAARRGFLLEVLAGGEVVAGALCRLHRREVTVLAYGVAAPHAHWLDAGALAAANLFLLAWAQEAGLARVDLLRSRPHTGDGVYEHKRRLGATASIDPWPHTVLWLRADGELPPAAAGLLVRRGNRLVSMAEATATGGA